jgi:anti-sigma factor RsiW
MTPECRRVLADISAYLDGDLDKGACESIEQHCATCAGCAKVVAGLKQTAGLCRQVAATPLPPAVLERARASLRRLLEESADNQAGPARSAVP